MGHDETQVISEVQMDDKIMDEIAELDDEGEAEDEGEIDDHNEEDQIISDLGVAKVVEDEVIKMVRMASMQLHLSTLSSPEIHSYISCLLDLNKPHLPLICKVKR